MSEKPNTTESKDELSEEQLDDVSGGFVIYGRFAHLPAVQGGASSPLLGGPDIKPAGKAPGTAAL